MRDAEEGEAASSEAGRSIYCEQMDGPWDDAGGTGEGGGLRKQCVSRALPRAREAWGRLCDGEDVDIGLRVLIGESYYVLTLWAHGIGLASGAGLGWLAGLASWQAGSTPRELSALTGWCCSCCLLLFPGGVMVMYPITGGLELMELSSSMFKTRPRAARALLDLLQTSADQAKAGSLAGGQWGQQLAPVAPTPWKRRPNLLR